MCTGVHGVSWQALFRAILPLIPINRRFTVSVSEQLVQNVASASVATHAADETAAVNQAARVDSADEGDRSWGQSHNAKTKRASVSIGFFEGMIARLQWG